VLSLLQIYQFKQMWKPLKDSFVAELSCIYEVCSTLPFILIPCQVYYRAVAFSRLYIRICKTLTWCMFPQLLVHSRAVFILGDVLTVLSGRRGTSSITLSYLELEKSSFLACEINLSALILLKSKLEWAVCSVCEQKSHHLGLHGARGHRIT
jgi:hypothetical protein